MTFKGKHSAIIGFSAISVLFCFFFFFFQAEDGIRDRNVTGVQTCALPISVSGSHACYNIYRTSDDRYVALGALEPKFWSAFCDRIGRRDLVPLQYIRGEAQARALDEIRALMQTRSQADWLALFRDVDVCLTPVLRVADALSDPHFLERGVVARYGGCTYVTSPIA